MTENVDETATLTRAVALLREIEATPGLDASQVASRLAGCVVPELLHERKAKADAHHLRDAVEALEDQILTLREQIERQSRANSELTEFKTPRTDSLTPESISDSRQDLADQHAKAVRNVGTIARNYLGDTLQLASPEEADTLLKDLIASDRAGRPLRVRPSKLVQFLVGSGVVRSEIVPHSQGSLDLWVW